MTRRLLLSYFLLTGFVLLVLEIPLGFSLAHNAEHDMLGGVGHDTTVLATLVEDTVEQRQVSAIAGPAGDYARRVGGRVVVVGSTGTTLFDSGHPSGAPEDFSNRPEIRQALAGASPTGVRYSATLGYDLAYASAPVASGGKVYGAVRITYSAAALVRQKHRVWLVLAAVGSVVLAAVLIVGWELARSTTRPLRSLEAVARRLAAGDLSARAGVPKGPPELRSLSDAFNQMASRLEELVTSQSEFSAHASHELRSPLTALRLRLENLEPALVRRRGLDDLEAAIEETQRLARIVDGLLVLARSGGSGPERESLDVNAAVRERVAAWTALAEEREVDLAVSAAGVQLAEAVPGHVDQILDNYLANALEVSHPGAIVTVQTGREGPWVEVHVLDEGPGLSGDELARVFERFWRGGGSRDGGSGLGLSIVRQLAGLSGGEAQLRARRGSRGVDAVVRLRAS
jgi:signal transduction histidine kinase